MIKDSKRRYPIERTRYTQSVGRLLEHRISQRFRELGFETKLNCRQSNNVDLKVYYQGQLILVAEILNWSTGSFLSEKRKRWIIKNLTSYKCDKVLIYTVFKNEYVLEDLKDHGISLIKIGYQILPRDFYNFYSRMNQIESRKIDSRETMKDVKSKILNFLPTSNIKMDNEYLVYSSLFENKIFLSFLPLEKANITNKPKRYLQNTLESIYIHFSKDSAIKTRKGEIDIHKYFRKFSKNVFDCLRDIRRYYLSGKFTLTGKLYHGTTSKFLHKIEGEGLIPSIPGQYWSVDENNWMKRVGLTNSMYAAEYFAYHAVRRFGGDPVVIEVDVNGLSGLKGKQWGLRSKLWAPLGVCVIDNFMEIYSIDVIPRDRIRNWYFLPDPSAYRLVRHIIRVKRLSKRKAHKKES